MKKLQISVVASFQHFRIVLLGQKGSIFIQFFLKIYKWSQSPTVTVLLVVIVEGIVVFFKVWDSTKKTIFPGDTLEDLYRLFFMKFPEMHEKFNEKRPPEFQISKTGDAKNAKELSDVKQLSPHCILELKMPMTGLIAYCFKLTTEIHNKRDYSFGYYEFQRQKLVFCMVVAFH